MRSCWQRFASFWRHRYLPEKARLRHKGIRTSKERVLRLLRENQLLSPARQSEQDRGNPHEGKIVTEAPDQMWGTDATVSSTEAEGAVTIFAAIDHYTAECVGIHVVKRGTRFEALEPIRQAVRERFGAFSQGCATGLRLRHDHGSVYMSDLFRSEISLAGIEPSPAFIRQPEGNGCIERFFRTLKEQYSGFDDFAISTSCAPRSSTSGIAITITGFCNG